MKTIALLLASVLLTCVVTLAHMPPAPQEWYDRMELPVPEGIKHAPPIPPAQIAQDLSQAAAERPKNTDALLLILVEFSDHPADTVAHPASAYDDLMFSHGAVATGSLTEYYEEVSYGTFSPAGTVTVWIQAPEPYSYYTDGNYGFGSYPNNSQGLLEDCIEILDPSMDFSTFDNNGDGYMEGVFLVHAGPGAEETSDPWDIWSHAWYFEVETDDGVSTGRYSAEPEEHYDGSLINIGVFCHEYGHVLGLPDLYDLDGSSEGIGVYCLMAGGSWGALPGNPERPTHMCAEMKYQLEWLTPTVISTDMSDLVITPVEEAATCYRVNHATDPNQYMLLEYRAKTGFDSLMRGDGGLAIWHVDYGGSQSEETHRYVSLEQADGAGDLERDYGTGNRHERTNRGDAGDLYPGAAGNTEFTRNSDPNSQGYMDDDPIVTITDVEQFDNDSVRIDLVPGYPDSRWRLFAASPYDTIGSVHDYDGSADSGEVCDLVLVFFNEGSAGAPTGVLTTSDSRVSIIDGASDFTDIGTHSYNANDPFRIEVLSGNNDSAVTFTVSLDGIQDIEVKLNINRQDILLVLDNEGSHWTDRLVEAIYRSGYSVDIARSETVTSGELNPYHAVVWTTGSYFGRRTSDPDYDYCLDDGEKEMISQYLSGNGRLALFSQDYLYDWDLDAFATGALHLGGFVEDELSTHIEGIPTGFLSGYEGFAPDWAFYDYTDRLTPGTGAAAVLRDVDDGSTVMTAYPSGGADPASEAVVFSGYALERLDDASLDALLPPLFGWLLTNANIDVPTPIYPKWDTLVSAPSVQLRWTASEGAVQYNYEVATDDEFSVIVSSGTSTGAALTVPESLADGGYYWRVSADPTSGPTTRWSVAAAFSYEYNASFVCGDADSDGQGPDIADLIYLVNWMFQEGPAPPVLATVDVNGDGDQGDIADLVYLVTYMFQQGDPLNCLY